MDRPHIVLLGAGASRAAFPEGDANGKRLPVMKDLVKILKLEDLLRQANVSFEEENFEKVYAAIHARGELRSVREELENRIYSYFDHLDIGKNATLYDYLVLCLREKDVIATFNWDPFLVQACQRNSKVFALPRILFLHGNVMAAFCANDKVLGPKGSKCSTCGRPLVPTQLLYPITEKDYETDPALSTQWLQLQDAMKDAFMFTVFGYSAPKSDESAIRLLKEGWGKPEDRSMEETEIIDVAPEKEVTDAWKPFIYADHYLVFSDFFDSFLAHHPRRTGEAYLAQIVAALAAEGNPVPGNIEDLAELQDWFLPLKEAETKTDSQ